ncbi:MAG: preprotein translocase subunit SecE [Gemmatimonadota bacterium]|nr:preprotein translocase subunit SecE [Gemmatimonadota bacterium]MDH5761145.1 preprotein translocase subunit SecE [Gemmatimonadota bacterium]
MAVTDHIKASKAFMEESWVELQKVTWPKWDELKSATLVVIVFVIAISAIIWGMDAVVRTLVAFIMRIFGA